MKASELLVQCLESEGVEYIFGIPGEENADLMMALSNSKIKFILTRHEQGAAFMADVYGRLTGKVGVCLATLGPGATNLVTGVANANMDRSRLLAITGQTDSHLLHKESHQNLNVVKMFEPITKWSWSIRNAKNIPEIVRRAFKIALTEKPGATHIELPQDIAKKESDIPPIGFQEIFRPKANQEQIRRAAKIILESKKPLLFVGNGCAREDESPQIRNFVEQTKIFSINTFMGKGVIPDDYETHLQTIGIKSADHALQAVLEADVIISVGYDLVEYTPKMWNSDLDKKIIHIDYTPSEVYTFYRPDVEIASDIGDAIDAILDEIQKLQSEDTSFDSFPRKDVPEIFQKVRSEVIERINIFKDDNSYPIKPEKLILTVREKTNHDDIVISDVGTHKLWISKIFQTFEPNTCIIPNGFASMGFSLPGVLAAKMVYPEKTIVAMTGDGGFLMNVQELETAVRPGLAVIVVVWVDNDLNLISTKQKHEFGKSAFTEFGNPDFVEIAQSFGAEGFHVKSTQEFAQVLEQAKSIVDKPVVIAVDVDYSRNEVLLDDSFPPYVDSLNHKN
ncbi:putative acetolactate synthase large subunit protein [Marine Group I thaumarchaeote SCGC AAA799-E16]|uniref:Putative acetolactate synthase large subunit protein n=4 Tax=Marine Group I TaxID=905826 RepID=A0A081RNK9_9ARCH|nr:putative acetolactate synthase large subunit protein [Marine Group I thaumarchaeote SCGC AAA799-N04]KER06284.1 putative acetolactate synthase large subunit protein [Marine Group I thaumarchaeote SCGC AAA799-E16]KFM15490.1 putative acetolactate synthase large subunit protein [Marine Group I thaumarchaeote SCGC AAA799-D11]KFM16732.1 putative acetolactate synthase large subunit protein [Marine Group I thaumarchaeote SCGC RSA3]